MVSFPWGITAAFYLLHFLLLFFVSQFSSSSRMDSTIKHALVMGRTGSRRQVTQVRAKFLSDGLGKSVSALVQTPLKEYQRGASAGSAFATAVRSVPAAAIAPVSACASAAHYALPMKLSCV